MHLALALAAAEDLAGESRRGDGHNKSHDRRHDDQGSDSDLNEDRKRTFHKRKDSFL